MVALEMKNNNSNKKICCCLLAEGTEGTAGQWQPRFGELEDNMMSQKGEEPKSSNGRFESDKTVLAKTHKSYSN